MTSRVQWLYHRMKAFYEASEGVYEVYLVDRNGLILAGISSPEWYRIGDMIAALFSVAEQLAETMGCGSVDHMLAQVSPPTVVIDLDSEMILMVVLQHDDTNLDRLLRNMREMGDELLGILNAP